MKIRPVILCGGAGTRLWPNSKNHQAKQFIDFGKWTLLGKTLERTKVSISELVIGLNCGGSDGFSSISANPALGLISDYLASQKSSIVLAETPEIYGAEHLLLDRCKNNDIKETVEEKIEKSDDKPAGYFNPENA